MKRLLLTLLVFGFANDMFAQCLGRRCAVSNVPPSTIVPNNPDFGRVRGSFTSGYRWVDVWEGEKALYYGDVQIGSINDRGQFRFIQGNEWGPTQQLFTVKNCDQPPVNQVKKSKDCACKPTCTCKDCLCAAPEQGIGQTIPNFGMNWNHNGSEKERYSISGKEVTPSQAVQAIGGDNLEDDSAKLDLTIISSNKALREQVLNDLRNNDKLKELLSQYKVSSYDPSHFHISGMGYQTDGNPTIYIQGPDGSVLHRQSDYSGGAERLASALRRARPDYDPAKDPDLTKPKPEPKPDPKPTPTPNPNPTPLNSSVVLMGIGAFLIWVLRR